MIPVTLVSGNKYKLQSANIICEPHGILIQQESLDIPEIQSLEGEAIARDKATKAYQVLKKPLIVEDSVWAVSGLNGFPGPYMAQMNQWFTVDDFARLFKPLTDRRITLTQNAVFQDEKGQHVFSSHTEGIILEKPQGRSKYPHSVFTSFDGGAHSSAEYGEAGKTSLLDYRTVWHEFAEWYSKEYGTVSSN